MDQQPPDGREEHAPTRPPYLNRSDLVWGGIIASGVVYELYALRRDLDYTLTRRTRHHWRVHHPVGKSAFLAGWTWLYIWYARHIIGGNNND